MNAENLGDVIEVDNGEVQDVLGKAFDGSAAMVYEFCKIKQVVGFRIWQGVYYGYESSKK